LRERRKKEWESVFHNLKFRRSVFPPSFNGEEVPDSEIELMLEAATWAPNHKMTEPWRFVVIRGKARERLGQFMIEEYRRNTSPDKILAKKVAKLESNPTRASAIIALCMQRDAAESVPEWEELAALSCAIQNMWLAASALGVGGYWSSPGLMKNLGPFLGLKAEICYGLFYLGYHDQQEISPKRAPWKDKVRWLNE